MSSEPRRGGVQSVDRALDVLQTLADQGTCGVSDVVRSTGLPLGTVHRLLATLTERGFARRQPDRRYAVGPAALGLVDAARNGIARVGAGYTRRLAAQFEESANLAVLQGDQMVYIAQTPSPHSLRIFAEVGRQVPLHSTAVGKAVLATMPDAAVASLLERSLQHEDPAPDGAAATLRGATRYTLTDIPAVLAECGRIRERGFAFDEQEQEMGVRCVAAAVPVAGAPSYAALSISGPAERFTLEAATAAGRSIQAVAAQFADALG